eukprot:CAMPEP_0194291550 /NCGR_PEP_ID=MMETSP0169-20130528/43609_1 /TAXON_ID=218684 /ORGANISM="Corethron pennatum, Strain L29A3" /LENGTH=303 /DNA_ID=CAMNT_0039039463 /DNA_START=91 /DNA_END=1002 /DNA_ORIENTATION=-
MGWTQSHTLANTGKWDALVSRLRSYPKEACEADRETRDLPLHMAVRRCPTAEAVGLLLALGPSAPEAWADRRALPIHTACKFAAGADVVSLLVSAYPGALRLPDYDGGLPLHLVFASGLPPTAVLDLVARGHRPAARVPDNEHLLPLHHAVVVSGGDSAAPDEADEWDGDGGRESFDRRCAEAVATVHGLYERAISIPSDDGLIPLHVACIQGSGPTVVSYLLKKHPTGAFAADRLGRLPLHLICRCTTGYRGKRADVVRLVLDAHPAAIRTSLGEKLPLKIAQEAGQDEEVLNILRAARKKK